jgi:hypothetical protein
VVVKRADGLPVNGDVETAAAQFDSEALPYQPERRWHRASSRGPVLAR